VAEFEEYSGRFRHVAIRRQDGIIELRLHTDGGPLVWGAAPHEELGYCFQQVGSDRDNRVVILTGTGDRFISRLDNSWVGAMTADKWDRIYSNGKRLLGALLDIEVPVVAAVNGPARVHAELAVLSDIVLASEGTFFQDAPHFQFATVPGDGAYAVWALLLGPNRGRHFVLTGATIDAYEAERLGVVAEVVPVEQLLDRAWEVARDLARQPDITLRYTREVMTMDLKRRVLADVGYGLALEGLASHETWPKG
jgi:enoyl-CoA hydratase/carnithine racemase